MQITKRVKIQLEAMTQESSDTTTIASTGTAQQIDMYHSVKKKSS